MKQVTNHTRLLPILTLIAVSSVGFLFAQGKPYEGPDDPAGDIAAEREGYMTGNRVFLYFRNTTELSDWPRSAVSKWPNNPQGTKMVDGVGLLIGAKVFIKNDPSTEVDTIPVTNPVTIATDPTLHELYYLQTSYREEMDTDPTGTVEWGFYPVFGYFNEVGEYPALSNIPSSWPSEGWPAPNYMTKWPGEWDGRFGRGVIYADQESYFVANDAQDQEALGPEDRVKYYPRPGRKIGDLRSNVTIQKGLPWGGLGLRVQVRGFQWNNPQARDAIFWEYTVANVSDYDLAQVVLGYWVDNAIGDDQANDELAYFDRQLDLAYSWDINALGRGGLPTGTMGFAYLESPGLPYDGIDNDGDGLLDEKRDNQATQLIGATDGINDLTKFLEVYNLSLEDLHEHWDADEDQDWEDGEDLNGDGIYQIAEFAGDDVGLDGVAPGELNYYGPDEGECNHRPDFVEGIGSEPNFAATDVSESDMVGLTSFQLFPVPSHAPSSETEWFKNDKAMWDVIGQDTLVEYIGSISNLIETFASGPFPLYQGRTERISMAELHSYDPLAGLESEEHSAPALYELKKIVQVIYEKDYRFAQPPKMPTLSATAGDGKVILTWDDVADTRTRDPFVGNVNDFEGYKLIRSTDKYMADSEVITDGYGTPMFLKPMYQCDLIDGRNGFTTFGLVNGMGYYLGSDNGITHHFIDNTVQNGRTYYYGLVAYDYGAPEIGPGIAPSENNIVIELDEAEDVRAIGKNVAIVTPHQKAAGYVPPSIEQEENPGLLGSGTVVPEILAGGSLKPDHSYRIRFGIDTVSSVSNYEHGILYTTSSFRIYDVTGGNVLVYGEDSTRYVADNLVYNDSLDYWTINPQKEISTDVFDGIQLRINLPYETASFSSSESGWVVGNGIMRVTPTIRESKSFPWNYDIIFAQDDSAYVGFVTNKTGIRDENDNRVNRSPLLTEQAFNFYVVNTSFPDSTGAYELMDLIVHDLDGSGDFDPFEDRILVGPVTTTNRWAGTVFIIEFLSADNTTYPESGDVYRVTFNRPFWSSDSIEFAVVTHDSLDTEELINTMKKIKVVPNPYVATNAMEPAISNPYLNQRRKLMFTHIPAKCTISIFTVSGVLVDQIDVENDADDGIVHWDLLTKEGLEIAAGMYLYHVKSEATGDEKLGKFAVIK